MKRAFDFMLAACLGLLLLLPIGVIALLVRWTSPGPALYWSCLLYTSDAADE